MKYRGRNIVLERDSVIDIIYSVIDIIYNFMKYRGRNIVLDRDKKT